MPLLALPSEVVPAAASISLFTSLSLQSVIAWVQTREDDSGMLASPVGSPSGGGWQLDKDMSGIPVDLRGAVGDEHVT